MKLSKYGKLQQYNSAAEEGCVEDILFRGNHLDVTVNIGGTMITGEWSLEKERYRLGKRFTFLYIEYTQLMMKRHIFARIRV